MLGFIIDIERHLREEWVQVKSQEPAFRKDLQTNERKGRLASLGRGL
jgi:hypothetical protein